MSVSILHSLDLLADLRDGDKCRSFRQRIDENESFSISHVPVSHSTEDFLQGGESERERKQKGVKEEKERKNHF